MRGYRPGAIWPAEDEDAVQMREVYSRYGLAMYMAQVLEHGMVNAVIIGRMMPTIHKYPDRSSWENAFDQAYDLEFTKTFGKILNALEHLALPGDLMVRLRNAKADRDRLAHRFFREHDLNLLGRSGRTRMIAECEDIIERFSAIDIDLETFMRPECDRYGITSEWVECHLSAAIAAAETKD